MSKELERIYRIDQLLRHRYPPSMSELQRKLEVIWTPFLRQRKQGHFTFNGKESWMGSRAHTLEFKIQIVERMLGGENVVALASQYKLARSMMYRWRDTYQQEGAGGLARGQGRGPGKPAPAPAGRGATKAASPLVDKLRERIAELERKVGQQAVEIDFFKGVFKRLEELPKARRRGSDASTARS